MSLIRQRKVNLKVIVDLADCQSPQWGPISQQILIITHIKKKRITIICSPLGNHRRWVRGLKERVKKQVVFCWQLSREDPVRSFPFFSWSCQTSFFRCQPCFRSRSIAGWFLSDVPEQKLDSILDVLYCFVFGFIYFFLFFVCFFFVFYFSYCNSRLVTLILLRIYCERTVVVDPSHNLSG